MRRLTPIIILILTALGTVCCHSRQPDLEFSSVSYHSDTLVPATQGTHAASQPVDATVSFDINLMLLADTAWPSFKKINHFILTHALTPVTLPDNAAANEAIRLFCETQRNAHDTLTTTAETCHHPIHHYAITAYAIVAEPYLLSYCIENKSSDAVTHSASSRQYYHFDPHTGTALHVNDFFLTNDTMQHALNQTARKAFHQQCKQDTTGLMNYYDDYASQITLTDNFRINETGIVLHYDIPLANSTTLTLDLEVPSYQLHDYLRPEGALYKYWFNK